MNIFDKHKDELSGMNWEDVLRNHAVIYKIWWLSTSMGSGNFTPDGGYYFTCKCLADYVDPVYSSIVDNRVSGVHTDFEA